MSETESETTAGEERPLFSDPRPELFGERPLHEPLFDPNALPSPSSGSRLRSQPTQAGSGLIDLRALMGQASWDRTASTRGTLVEAVRPIMPNRQPSPRPTPSRLQWWLVPSVTALCTVVGVIALIS